MTTKTSAKSVKNVSIKKPQAFLSSKRKKSDSVSPDWIESAGQLFGRINSYIQRHSEVASYVLVWVALIVFVILLRPQTSSLKGDIINSTSQQWRLGNICYFPTYYCSNKSSCDARWFNPTQNPWSTNPSDPTYIGFDPSEFDETKIYPQWCVMSWGNTWNTEDVRSCVSVFGPQYDRDVCCAKIPGAPECKSQPDICTDEMREKWLCADNTCTADEVRKGICDEAAHTDNSYTKTFK